MITPFDLDLDGFSDRLAVRSLEGREALSKAWDFRVVVRAEGGANHDLEQRALGASARLVFNVKPESPRAWHGVIAGVRLLGRRERDACDYELRVVPRLWLLKRKRRTRIFQNVRVVDVVASVLGEAGIASRWQLRQHYPVREYCTQYEETDYQLVLRLLAEAGIFFCFHQGGASALATAGSLAGAVAGASTFARGLAAAMAPVVAGDSLVCADDAMFYPPLGGGADLPASLAASAASAVGLDQGTAGAVVRAVSRLAEGDAPALSYAQVEDMSETLADKVIRFQLANSVRPNAAMFREYDPDRPLVRFSSSAVSNTPFGDEALEALAGALAAASGAAAESIAGSAAGAAASAAVAGAASGAPLPLEVYDHHAPLLFPKWTHPSDEAARMLRQARRRASVASGESGCPELAPGHRFALQGCPVPRLDQTYAVTSVRHRGRVHQGATRERVYECSFECVPASVTYAPKKPKRRSVQVCLTATVTGPRRSEIHVDEKGQIKVQFHWDREQAGDDTSSCWIRAMQPWAGANWGVQFIPRVGMEVVVVFEGGDPDKPMVLGALANAAHPMPFPLPVSKTRSGFRTSSSPGGAGFNELSFEDSAGEEQILLQAQRDLAELVGHDHTVRVDNDEILRVLGNRIDTIERDLRQLVLGDRSEETHGNRVEIVAGSADERVTGSLTTRVEGRSHHALRGDAAVECQSDATLKLLGSLTTVVGREDKPRSWVTHAHGVAALTGTKRVELRSDEELVLTVGKSALRMAKDRIELSADAISLTGGDASFSASKDGLALASKGDGQLVVDKKLVVKTKGASIALEQELKLDGAQILLNSPEKAKDPPPPEPEPPTTIVLKDREGAPLAEQRFRIQLADGSELTGKTDARGEAVLELTQGGEIMFPDLKMRGDTQKGAPQPYVVRQGDHLPKLAFQHGFDPDAVWSDEKNAELRAKRKDPNQLCPGDVLYFAAASKQTYPVEKGTTNEYSASVPTVHFELVLTDDLAPFVGETYKVEGLPRPITDTVKADRLVKLDVPVHVREVRLVFEKRGLVLPIRIGDLDPASEPSGVRTRLENLGYLRASAEPLSEREADERLVTAIRHFQRDHGLEPTGENDPPFQAELVAAHGS